MAARVGRWGGALGLFAIGLVGCGGHSRKPLGDAKPSVSAQPDPKQRDAPSAPAAFVPTPSQALAYMQLLVKTLVARSLTEAEETELSSDGQSAITPMLRSWTKEDAFIEFARQMIELSLGGGGAEAEPNVDFELPGRLVAHVVKHDLPWSEVITSATCFDADDAAIPCDTQAPFNAGLLTTRAFLVSNLGRYNVGRAAVMTRAFACRTYPFEEELQPFAEAERLVPELRVTEPPPAGDFGAAPSCYACHGQFAPHAQLFVKFDRHGIWEAAATGLQAVGGVSGDSNNGFFASHYEAPDEAESERSNMLGDEVENLAEAAQVLGVHDVFNACATQSLLDYVFQLDHQNTTPNAQLPVASQLLADIVANSRAENPSLPLSALAIHTFGDSRVQHVALAPER